MSISENQSEYDTWCAMKNRCKNPNDARYEDYGGRGISICSRWDESFPAFLHDMGKRPNGKSLDRWPDKDGNYCKGNCRWATIKEQQNNIRSNVWLTLGGEMRTISQWAEKTGLSHHIISKRLKIGWTTEWALNTQIGGRPGNLCGNLLHKMDGENIKRRFRNGKWYEECRACERFRHLAMRHLG